MMMVVMMMRLILIGCLFKSLVVTVGGAVDGQKSVLLNRLLADHSSDVTTGRGRSPRRMTPDVCIQYHHHYHHHHVHLLTPLVKKQERVQ